MRKLELDFVERSAFGKPLGLLLMLAGLSTAAVSVTDALDVAEAKADLQTRKIDVSRGPGEREGAQARAATATHPEDLRALREASIIAARLRTPWQRLFDDTAQAAGSDIALTGLQPDPVSRNVRIAGLARDLPAVNRFVGNLLDKPGFAGAYIVQHDTQPKDAEAPLAFVVLANWREDLR